MGVGNARPEITSMFNPTTAELGPRLLLFQLSPWMVMKKGVSSPIILPDFAVLDPVLTLGLPAATTAATGIDAMVHAIEAYASKNKNNNPMSGILQRRHWCLGELN